MRSRAMGGANGAAPVDTSTIIVNPAGIGRLGKTRDDQCPVMQQNFTTRARLSIGLPHFAGAWWALALDALVALAILFIVAAALQWRRRRRRIWQFSLAELLGLTLLFVLAQGVYMMRHVEPEDEAEERG